jgi:PUA-domain protein
MSPTELKIRQRHMLKSKDIKTMIEQMKEIFGEDSDMVGQILTPKSQVEWIKLDDNQELYAIDGKLAFLLEGSRFIPLISFLIDKPLPFKIVKVDTGAIRFVSSGADVMRPGIIFIDPQILKGDIVVIQDPVHGRALAVGEAMFSGAEIQSMDKGKVIKSLHSVSDTLWAFSKTFK